jgi:cyclase
MRVLRPHPAIYAFYDGRVEGRRFAEEPNWVDEGALSLGIASYAVVDGDEALVYDTHITPGHARQVRAALERAGVRRFTVLLSHWHLDHVAGTGAFADCDVLATRRTAELLAAHRAAIEAGTHHGPPAIDPLVLPTRALDGPTTLAVGRLTLNVLPVEIHSADAAVVCLPEERILMAGDTLEDTLTFVAEPDRLAAHLTDLDRLEALAPDKILPNHGSPDVIAAGGYGVGLVGATRSYVELLLRSREERALRELPVRELLAAPLAAGWIEYFPPYEAVHRANLEKL